MTALENAEQESAWVDKGGENSEHKLTFFIKQKFLRPISRAD
jgi:hypothetical protein